jgi:hypothetical protein
MLERLVNITYAIVFGVADCSVEDKPPWPHVMTCFHTIEQSGVAITVRFTVI